MKNILNISEATVIALHATVFLLNKNSPVSANIIAEGLGVSKHHLSKILRELVINNIISSIKGPSGGFFITPKQSETSFMEIFEIIDGKFIPVNCLFNKPPCIKSQKCIMSDFLCRLNSEFKDHFNNTKIKNFKEK